MKARLSHGLRLLFIPHPYKRKVKSNAATMTRAKKQTSHRRGLFVKSGKRLKRSTTRCEWSLRDVGFSKVQWASVAPQKTRGNMRRIDPVKTNFSTACQCWENERFPHHQCQANQLRWASRPKRLRKHTLAMTTKGFKYKVPWDAEKKNHSQKWSAILGGTERSTLLFGGALMESI